MIAAIAPPGITGWLCEYCKVIYGIRGADGRCLVCGRELAEVRA